jgi:phage host-nuclease inhibitor protein Gam
MDWLMDLIRLPQRVADLEARAREMDARMSAVDDVVRQLNEATNDVADDVERLRAEVQGSDAATAEKFTPIIERLRALAVDPENPVPPTV